jgi:hypothetical protein
MSHVNTAVRVTVYVFLSCQLSGEFGCVLFDLSCHSLSFQKFNYRLIQVLMIHQR